MRNPPGPGRDDFLSGCSRWRWICLRHTHLSRWPDLNVRGDTYGVTVWDENSQTWQQVMKSPNMDACGIKWVWWGNVYEIAVAPSNSARIYLIATNFKNGTIIGSHSASMNWMTIYRSDDRGATWSPTRMTTFQGSLGHRLSGPKMRVDPNNPDIVYAGNLTGIFFVSYNGGENWTRIDPLLAALLLARTSGAQNRALRHSHSAQTRQRKPSHIEAVNRRRWCLRHKTARARFERGFRYDRCRANVSKPLRVRRASRCVPRRHHLFRIGFACGNRWLIRNCA